jgi:hypothetical protein
MQQIDYETNQKVRSILREKPKYKIMEEQFQEEQ